MLHWGIHTIAETLDELVEPSRCGLLMWDFASRLVSRAFNSEVFIQNTQQLLEAARKYRVPVFYSQQNDMSLDEAGPGLVRMRMKQLGIAGSLERVLSNRKNSARPPFAEALKPADNDVVFEKFSPSAFLGTNFEWRLRSRGVQTVIITGISLETGVEGTAREALNRGFYAVIVRDCSSTSERENYDLAMPIIERLFDVADSQDIIRAWESSTDHQRQSSLDK